MKMRYWLILSALLVPSVLRADGGTSRVLPGVVVLSGSVVASDGVLGTVGNDSFQSRVQNTLYVSSFTVATSTYGAAGTVSYAHVYMANGNTQGFTVSLHDSTGAVLAYKNATLASNATGWYHFQLDTTVSIAAATVYWGGIVTNDTSWTLYENRVTCTGSARQNIAQVYSTVGQSFVPGSISLNAASQCWTIYFNNSATVP